MEKGIKELISDLYWEWDRMSSSGQDTLEKLANKFGVITNKELAIRLDAEEYGTDNIGANNE
jgi:hypothetical protein